MRDCPAHIVGALEARPDLSTRSSLGGLRIIKSSCISTSSVCTRITPHALQQRGVSPTGRGCTSPPSPPRDRSTLPSPKGLRGSPAASSRLPGSSQVTRFMKPQFLRLICDRGRARTPTSRMDAASASIERTDRSRGPPVSRALRAKSRARALAGPSSKPWSDRPMARSRSHLHKTERRTRWLHCIGDALLVSLVADKQHDHVPE